MVSFIIILKENMLIEDTLKSIFSQTYKNYEIIIICEDSNISSPILSYIKLNNIKLLLFENNESIGKRLNQAISIAKNPYINIIINNIIFFRNGLNILVENFSSAFDIVSGEYVIKDYQLNRLSDIFISTSLISKECINQIGGFNESLSKGFIEDLLDRVPRKKKVTKVIGSIREYLRYNLPTKLQKYPLEKYWDIKRVLSVLSNDTSLKTYLSKPWVLINRKIDSDVDVIITWGYYSELDTFNGSILYFLDGDIDQRLYDMCDGIISRYYIRTDKPLYILRPPITKEILNEKIKSDPVTEVQLFFPYITDSNYNIVYGLLELIKRNHKFIKLYYASEKDYNFDMLSENVNLPIFLQCDRLNKLNITAVINLSTDISKCYEALLFSAITNIPLISVNNIIYNNLLEDRNHLCILNSIEDISYFINICQQDRSNLTSNLEKVLLENFMFDVNSSKFTLFLNEFYSKKEESIFNIISLQPESNNTYLMLDNITISQEFKCSENIKGIELFFENINYNINGNLDISIYKDNTEIRHIIFEGHKIKLGSNKILFNEIINIPNNNFMLKIKCLPNYSIGIKYLDSVQEIGNMYVNGSAIKGCLKFGIVF